MKRRAPSPERKDELKLAIGGTGGTPHEEESSQPTHLVRTRPLHKLQAEREDELSAGDARGVRGRDADGLLRARAAAEH